MKKIKSLFKRDYQGTRQVYDEVLEGSEWVTEGKGIATEKIDGTSCMVRDGKLYKRYDAKKGKTPPEGWEACEPEPNEQTGHWPGWLPVGDGAEDKWHREAFSENVFNDGTFELVGPKIQGNPYNHAVHHLIRHGIYHLPDAPRDFEGIKKYLTTHHIEGIVWHNGEDMVKIKARDFGIPWGKDGKGVK